MSLFIRTTAIFIYVLAIMLGLKSLADMMTGTAELEGHWGLSLSLLVVALAGAICAWLIDRRYCKADSATLGKREE